MLFSFYLRKVGVEFVIVDNGQQAIDLLNTAEIDVVLMDVQMPIMDGLTAVMKLRASGYTKPIIALTANAMREDREYALSIGFTDFVAKPVNRQDLIATLAKYLPKIDKPDDQTSALISSLVRDNPEMSDILLFFVDELPKYVSLLKDNSNTGNWSEVKKTAHDIKGFGGSYGFTDLTQLGKQIEFQLAKSDYKEVLASTDALERMADRILKGRSYYVENIKRTQSGQG
jgi:CheY-like chemotaxis protein